VRIHGRDYVDGGVTKTAHINLAIRAGCDLVICVNPLVPIRNASRRSSLGPLAGHGLDTVLGQVLRVLLHGRFEYGLDRYRVEHPEVDILLIEPSREDLTMFRYDIMRYSARRALAHHGRASGAATLRRRRARFSKLLRRHGLAYRETPRAAPRAARTADAPSFTNLSSSLDRLERAIGA
jgi:predicted acylesterase/phospholipase RssA